MHDFRIIIVPSTLESTDSGVVTGEIWMRLGNIAFPEQGWNDFAVVILGWWLQALCNDPKATGRLLFRFMDGPFIVDITSEDGKRLRVVASHATTGAKVASCESTIDELRRQLVAAARLVTDHCNERGIQNDDTWRLGRCLMTLSA